MRLGWLVSAPRRGPGHCFRDFVENGDGDPHLLDVGVNLVKLYEVAEDDGVLRPPVLLPRSEQYFPGARLFNDLG